MELRKYSYYDVWEIIPLVKNSGFRHNILELLLPWPEENAKSYFRSISLADVERYPETYDKRLVDFVQHLRKIGIEENNITINISW